ncbi:thiamine-phosphate kinase [Haladaptatus sp. W1]|uniref:thiamine-phosphate kinase n=2 Tax=Haladaptatus sp. W1 TaxID=1897478 RepID=UPI000849AB4A|nr:thiamine-phosphate kinase [Haladaptatus sp. W1]ODR83539.1 thiamine-phosphate kinase [Haladaptatus sp. W1]
MDERAALRLLEGTLSDAGDDAAVIDGHVLTTDMLHETTDFPDATTRYTAGWRSVGASLSDVAAMGANAVAGVAVYAAPEFDPDDLESFVAGASDVCESVGARYVGGDLDTFEEFTASTTVLGETDDPVLRSGAEPGDALCVTGTLGRSGAALRLFEAGEIERANELFRFEPRVAAGRALAPFATAMMDSSDGLARSVHQLAEASECGFELDGESIPVADSVREVATDADDERDLSLFFGEDFELVFTVPKETVEDAREASPTPISVVGSVTEDGIQLDDEALPDRGYTHGE